MITFTYVQEIDSKVDSVSEKPFEKNYFLSQIVQQGSHRLYLMPFKNILKGNQFPLFPFVGQYEKIQFSEDIFCYYRNI